MHQRGNKPIPIMFWPVAAVVLWAFMALLLHFTNNLHSDNKPPYFNSSVTSSTSSDTAPSGDGGPYDPNSPEQAQLNYDDSQNANNPNYGQ